MRKDFTFNEVHTDKATLRKELVLRRRNITNRAERDRAITEKLIGMLYGNVMIYVSIGSEADTRALIAKLLDKTGVRLFAPYTEGGIITPRTIVSLGDADKHGNMPENSYGEKIKDGKIDVCVIPLLGFNDRGYRIGYGLGCYDRFLSENFMNNVLKIGVAYADQFVSFDADDHDVPLDRCVTEKKVIYF